MPDSAEASGYHIRYSSDGANFYPFATLTNPDARTFTAANLDYLTTYTFQINAYNTAGDSDNSDTASQTTTNDEWTDLDRKTPNPADANQPHWFGTSGGSGTPWDQGTYRINYAGGAYYTTLQDPNPWRTAFYSYTTADPATYTQGYTSNLLWGVTNQPSQEDAQYATLGTTQGLTAWDPMMFGVRSPGSPLDPNTSHGPGDTWTFQRRVPHAGVYATNDITKEGAQPGNSDYAAVLYFWRDDRILQDLTVGFTVSGAALPNDYTLIAKIPNGHGGFSNVPITDSLTFPASTLDDPIYAIEVDVIANNDSNPEWTEDLQVRLDDNSGDYIADHPNDRDGLDENGDGEDQDPDAVVNILDNDMFIEMPHEVMIGGGADDHLFPVSLNYPRDPKPNTTITLSASTSRINVWADERKTILLLSADTVSSKTWPTAQVPFNDTVYIEAVHGSAIQNDVGMTISGHDDPDGPAPSNNAADDAGTTVTFKTVVNGQVVEPNGEAAPVIVGQYVGASIQVEGPPDLLAEDRVPAWEVGGGSPFISWGRDATPAPDKHDRSIYIPFADDYTRGWSIYWHFAKDEDEIPVSTNFTVAGTEQSVEFVIDAVAPTITQAGPALDGPDLAADDNADDYKTWDVRGGLFRWGNIVTMPAGFAGTGYWNYLQLGSNSIRFHDAVSGKYWRNALNGVEGLDTDWPGTPSSLTPYDATAPGGVSAWKTDSLGIFIDLPTDPLDELTWSTRTLVKRIDWYSRSMDMKTYLMFNPGSPNDAWVPLKMTTWSWGATARVINEDKMAYIIGSYANLGPVVTSSDHPRWTVNIGFYNSQILPQGEDSDILDPDQNP